MKKKKGSVGVNSAWTLPVVMLVVGAFLGVFLIAPLRGAKADDTTNNGDINGLRHVVDQILLSGTGSGGSGTGNSLWTMSGYDIFNSNSGRVGVGTANPGAKLEVNGDLKFGGTADPCNQSKAGTIKYVDNNGTARDQIMVCKRGTDTYTWGWWDLKDSEN